MTLAGLGRVKQKDLRSVAIVMSLARLCGRWWGAALSWREHVLPRRKTAKSGRGRSTFSSSQRILHHCGSCPKPSILNLKLEPQALNLPFFRQPQNHSDKRRQLGWCRCNSACTAGWSSDFMALRFRFGGQEFKTG